jgi:phenylpropionate dioxygenase-like ring-hydroxylating dioxygenase large terminal subunit
MAEMITDLVRDAAIHSSVYTSEDVFAAEMRTIFGNGWVFVGHDSEVPARGNFVRRTVGMEEVVMVRTRDGAISVLSNRCTHRGNLLCSEERGTRRSAITCQYHGWVFSFGGELLDVPAPDGSAFDRQRLALRRARVGIHRGFVFANFADDPEPFETYLGHAAALIDQTVELSPVGELQLDGGWGRHIFHGNWKLLAENNTDGYHVNYVHESFARGIKVHGKYEHVLVDDRKLEPVARDLGNGHVDLDYTPAYREPLVWLGTAPDRYPEYTRLMDEAYGEHRAREILRRGPPHAFIFPNLFIAEGTITMIQPLGVGRCVNWNTPLFLKGVPREVNTRILRQVEAAVGPSAFLLADDATISERQQRAMSASPGWLDLSRGLQRERRGADGTVVSHFSDETPNRGFWRHYRSLFRSAAAEEIAS